MKRIFLILAVLLGFTALFAGDVYNQSSSVEEDGYTYAVFRVNFDFTDTDSIGNKYSKAINIGDMNLNDGYITIVVTNDASGTEDIDFTLQYSADGSVWVDAAADDELTQVTAGTTSDTLGIVDGVNDFLFHTHTLLRIKADGQAGNPIQASSTTGVYAFISLTKDVAPSGRVNAVKPVRNSN